MMGECGQDETDGGRSAEPFGAQWYEQGAECGVRQQEHAGGRQQRRDQGVLAQDLQAGAEGLPPASMIWSVSWPGGGDGGG
jgi:hypothetical protein